MPYYHSGYSPLAIASLVMGVLCLTIGIFCLTLSWFCTTEVIVIQILLSIAAVVTGFIATRRTSIFPIKGHRIAYAGLVCGANGIFWVITGFIFRFVR